MLHVNDDMDELFRNAAENYPLKTEGSDWNKVKAGLAPQPPATAPSSTNSKFWLFGLLLLIPLVWLSINYFSNRKALPVANGALQQSTHQLASAEATNKNSVSIAQANNQPKAGDNITANTASAINPINTSGNSQPSLAQTSHSVSGSRSSHFSKDLMHTLHSSGKTKVTIGPGIVSDGPQPSVPVNSNKEVQKDNFAAQDHPLSIKDENPSTKDNPTAGINKLKVTEQPSPLKNVAKPLAVVDKPDMSKEVVKKESALKSPAGKKTDKPFFYAGLIAGLDVSTVRMQNIFNSGVQGGVLVGYNFGRRISIESGLYLDKKYYYTDGRYFDSKELYLQGNAKLIDVKGNCLMMEVPINVTYRIATDQKSQWFALAGVSSYFMKRQTYDYGIQYNSYTYQKTADYNTASNSFLSVINLGAGLTRPLGKKTSLRIEPYFKIPLQRIGVGDLPITSAGINIGITRKF